MSGDSDFYENNTDNTSDFSSDEYENYLESLNIKNMVKVEKEVYEVYSYLQRTTFGKDLLQYVSLSDVYNLVDPNYKPIF